MELYKFLTTDELKKVKEKTEIRNVKIVDLTFNEIIDLSHVLNSSPEKMIKRIWKAL